MSQKRIILIVDDDIDFARLNRFVLEKAGYEVVTAHTGAEGVEKARETRPDAILLDYMIDTPNEGAKVAQALRADAALKEVPVLLLTAVGRIKPWLARELRPNREWLPVNKILEKPVTPEQLLEELALVLPG